MQLAKSIKNMALFNSYFVVQLDEEALCEFKNISLYYDKTYTL